MTLLERAGVGGCGWMGGGVRTTLLERVVSGRRALGSGSGSNAYIHCCRKIPSGWKEKLNPWARDDTFLTNYRKSMSGLAGGRKEEEAECYTTRPGGPCYADVTSLPPDLGIIS